MGLWQRHTLRFGDRNKGRTGKAAAAKRPERRMIEPPM
jgi:hypothetical protein